MLRYNLPHCSTENRYGKVWISAVCLLLQIYMVGFYGSGKAIRLTKYNHKAAALSGFHIPLIAKQTVGMLHRNRADTGFLRKAPFRGQL